MASPSSSSEMPPPLPPRVSRAARTGTVHLTPAEAALHHGAAHQHHPYPSGWTSHDPRSSSTQSLLPPERASDDGRRRLLLVFIHGFMGNETSFRSFPAHLHNLLTVTVADTHVVHTKIYPRYRSRRPLEAAVQDFSKWLMPHETPTTDVVLLGHSMGGLLAAEVVLLPQDPRANRNSVLKHRLIGSVNFDVPFLGIHPGVVGSGLASLFRPSPEPPGRDASLPATNESESASSLTSPSTSTLQSFSTMGSQEYSVSSSSASASTPNLSQSSLHARVDTLFTPRPSDPNFNPRFSNDINLPIRKGWEGALHFFNKHSDGLVKATKQYVKSHIEFGGAMANYPSLKNRYRRLRALEEEDEHARAAYGSGMQPPPRVRFVNYYTASTGRLKEPPPESDEAKRNFSEMDLEPSAPLPLSNQASLSPSRSPRISIEEHQESGVIYKPLDADNGVGPGPKINVEESVGEASASRLPVADLNLSRDSSRNSSLEILDPQPWTDDEEDIAPTQTNSTAEVLSNTNSASEVLSSTNSISEVLSPQPSNGRELPPLPPLPQEPAPIDVSQYTDKDTRKIVEKEHAQALKGFKQAIKVRNKAIKEREKLKEKWRKQDELATKEAAKKEAAREAAANAEASSSNSTGEAARLEAEAARVKAEGDRLREDARQRDEWERARVAALEGTELPPPSSPLAKEKNREEPLHPLAASASAPETGAAAQPPPFSSPPPSPPPSYEDSYSQPTSPVPLTRSPLPPTAAAPTPPAKPLRDRKFCVLPSKNPRTGKRDPTWVRIYMEGVDEVGAHCGLFFLNETYERLVGEVAEQIEDWVQTAEGERVAREMSGHSDVYIPEKR